MGTFDQRRQLGPEHVAKSTEFVSLGFRQGNRGYLRELLPI